MTQLTLTPAGLAGPGKAPEARPPPVPAVPPRHLAIRALVAAAQGGDRQAQAQLLVEYRGLCKRLAHQWSRRSWAAADFDDYHQVARLAVLQAASAWDEGRAQATGTKSFTTYLFRAITSRLQRHQQLDRLVHVPVHVKDEHGRLPPQRVAWLDAPVTSDSDSAPRLAFHASASDVEGEAAANEAGRRMRAALQHMRIPPRARDVLRGRLLDGESRAELAERWGVTDEMIRRIECRHMAKAMASLRMAFRRPSKRLDTVLAKRARAEAARAAVKVRRAAKGCSVHVGERSGIPVACGLPARRLGMCVGHYERWRAGARGPRLESPIGRPRGDYGPTTKILSADHAAIRARFAELLVQGLRVGAAHAQLAAERGVVPRTIERIVRAPNLSLAA